MRYRVEPKPFRYVSIPKTAPTKAQYVKHDVQKDLTGRLELNLQVVSEYLFVGSGNYDFQNKLVYYSFFRNNGNLAIPSTSIKGAVRSVVEAISNSCASQLASKKKTGPNRYKPDEKNYIYKKHTHFPCKDISELCIACRLFGSADYGGRAGFSDALPLEKPSVEIVKIGELFAPTIVRNDKRKFYQNKTFKSIGNLKPEKNYRFVEAVKKGGKFKTVMSFYNIV
ncbi:MAG: RAMP superfamily CRISPR-associated protein [Methanosarcinales archaeon]